MDEHPIDQGKEMVPLGKIGKSKLTKYYVMRRDRGLHSALPSTAVLSKENMLSFLDKYSKVVAKPAGGSGGAGVMMVKSVGDNKYTVQSGAKKRTVKGKSDTYSYVRSRTKIRYLVQRGISLARVNGRPFDIRVMVQRRKGSSWKVTGMMVKVAGAGYIITNIKRSGGRALPLVTAIKRSNIRGISTSSLLARIQSLALRSARRLATYYSGHRVFGLDMGIDSKGRVWIIEANLTPDITLFLKIKDKSMYRKIVAYKRK